MLMCIQGGRGKEGMAYMWEGREGSCVGEGGGERVGGMGGVCVRGLEGRFKPPEEGDEWGGGAGYWGGGGMTGMMGASL